VLASEIWVVPALPHSCFGAWPVVVAGAHLWGRERRQARGNVGTTASSPLETPRERDLAIWTQEAMMPTRFMLVDDTRSAGVACPCRCLLGLDPLPGNENAPAAVQESATAQDAVQAAPEEVKGEVSFG